MKLDHIKACQKSLLLVHQKLIWAWDRGQKVKFAQKSRIFLSGGPLVPRGLFFKYPFMQMKSTKIGFMLADDDLFQITQYVEYSGVTALFKAELM